MQPDVAHESAMIDAMKRIPTQSGQIMRDIWGPAFAANIKSWSVTGQDEECPREVTYEFFDGTSITWRRPDA